MNERTQRPILILGQSYPHIKSILYLIDLHYKKSKKIKLLIFNNRYLFEFLTEINIEYFDRKIDINLVKKYKPKFQNIFFRYSFIFEKYFLSRSYKKYCSNVSGYCIYFFSKEFTNYSYFFLRKLYKNNNVIHIQDPACDVYDISDGKPKNFKSLIRLLYFKALFGKDYAYGETGRVGFKSFYKISEKFYNKILSKKILKNERDKIQKGFQLTKFSIKKYSNLKALYFDKDVVKDNLCRDEVFQKEINDIFKIINEYFCSDEIGRKYKPNRTTNYNKSRIKIGKVIPDHYPAEILYNDNINVYFGVTSIALSNIPRGLVISLVYLLTFEDQKKRDGSIHNQEKRKRGKIIHYPKTLNELRFLLKRIK